MADATPAAGPPQQPSDRVAFPPPPPSALPYFRRRDAGFSPLFLLARFTASRRPRSRATWSDSTLRPRRRRPGPPPRTPAPVLGRGRRSAGSRRGPGRCVPRPGSARGRGGPGSRPRPPPSRRWPGLSHGRGARRGRRRGSHPRARGRRARRRPLISPGAPGRDAGGDDQVGRNAVADAPSATQRPTPRQPVSAMTPSRLSPAGRFPPAHPTP